MRGAQSSKHMYWNTTTERTHMARTSTTHSHENSETHHSRGYVSDEAHEPHNASSTVVRAVRFV